MYISLYNYLIEKCFMVDILIGYCRIYCELHIIAEYVLTDNFNSHTLSLFFENTVKLGYSDLG